MSKQTEDEAYRKALESRDTEPAPPMSQEVEDAIDGFKTESVGETLREMAEELSPPTERLPGGSVGALRWFRADDLQREMKIQEARIFMQARNIVEADRLRAENFETRVNSKPSLPQTSKERKRTPLCSGVLDYFPAALAAVARVSYEGNEKHNQGQPLHHARGKSTDHADCILRHLVERGKVGPDGMRHSASLAWRALALLQEELEAEGYEMARGAKK